MEKSRGCGWRTSIGAPRRYTSAIPRPEPTLKLPLMAEAGEALLNYLRRRPTEDKTFEKTFDPHMAPYRRLFLYSEVRRRLEAAGVKPPGEMRSSPYLPPCSRRQPEGEE